MTRALLEAVSSDNHAAVKCLLAKGVNAKVVTKKGQTAAAIARSVGSPKIAKLLEERPRNRSGATYEPYDNLCGSTWMLDYPQYDGN